MPYNEPLLSEGLWLAGGVTRPVGAAAVVTVATSIMIDSVTGLVDGSIDLPTVRRDHCAVKLHDGRVMIIGKRVKINTKASRRIPSLSI